MLLYIIFLCPVEPKQYKMHQFTETHSKHKCGCTGLDGGCLRNSSLFYSSYQFVCDDSKLTISQLSGIARVMDSFYIAWTYGIRCEPVDQPEPRYEGLPRRQGMDRRSKWNVCYLMLFVSNDLNGSQLISPHPNSSQLISAYLKSSQPI